MSVFRGSRAEPINIGDDWEFYSVRDLVGGLNLDENEQDIEDRFCVNAKNVRFDRNQVEVDFGSKKFAQIVVGRPRASYEFFRTTGVQTLVLITNETVYKYNEVQGKWHFVDNGVSTTLTAAASQGDLTITVSSITGFVDGSYIGIDLDDGEQHQTTINGTPTGSTITLTDPIPSAAAIGKAVGQAPDLSGSDDLGVSITTWAAVDKMYFTNGVDTPKQFDGTSVTDIQNLPGTTFTCRIVIVFRERLLLLFTTEDGTQYPQRKRWSDALAPTSWNSSVNYVDLQETEDWISAAELLGPFLIIYKERSIVRQSFIGAIDKTWDFQTMIYTEGVKALESLIPFEDNHLLWGSANVYRYEGRRDLTPMADRIFHRIFSESGNLDGSKIGRLSGVFIEELDDLTWFYPGFDDTFPARALRQRQASGALSEREYPFEVCGHGFFATENPVTWNDLVGPWTAQTFAWGSRVLNAGAPTVHLCTSEDVVNLIKWSEELDRTYWVKQFATITPNVGEDQFGNQITDQLTEDTSNNIHRVRTPNIAVESGKTYGLSMYVQDGATNGRRYVRPGMTSGSVFPANTVAVFDLQTGAFISTGSTIGQSVEDLGGGRYRIAIFQTATGTGDTQGVLDLYNGSTATYTGDGLKNVYTWGHQFEEIPVLPGAGLYAPSTYKQTAWLNSPVHRVLQMTYREEDDDGVPISYEFETKEWESLDYSLRFDRHTFYLAGLNVTIQASFDGGNSWETLLWKDDQGLTNTTFSPGTQVKKVDAYLEKVSHTIRYRFSGIGRSFVLRGLGFTFRRESLWEPA